MKITQRKQMAGSCMMFLASMMMVTAPKVAVANECAVLAQTLGIGWGTALALDVAGGAVCAIASAGLATPLCVAGAAI